MFKKILVPLDGSAFAEAALPLATAVARRSGAAIELVNVHEPAPNLAYDEWEAAAREWSLSYLRETEGRLRDFSPGQVTTTVLAGRVSDALVQHAEASDSDLVVMATHGRGALTRAWLGSVADAFVRHTDRPVLLVRPDEDEGPADLAAEVALDHVLIPLDGSDLSKQIVEPALALGSLFDARYTLVRIVTFPTELASPYIPHTVRLNREFVDEARVTAESYLGEQAAELRARGFRVESEVLVDGQAAHVVLGRAAELDVSMLALATHGRGAVARALLGSTTDKVIRGAHRPVLVVRPLDVE